MPIKLKMMFSDLRSSWSENWWWYSPSAPEDLDSAYAAAINLLTARGDLLAGAATCDGGVLSYADATRDGYPVSFISTGAQPFITGGSDARTSDNPWSAIRITCSSAGIGSGVAYRYSKRSFLSGVPDDFILRAQFSPNGRWNTAWRAFIAYIMNLSGAYSWGWRAKSQEIGIASYPFAATDLTIGSPPNTINIQLPVGGGAVVATGDQVKISQAVQGVGRSQKLNGIWTYLSRVGDTVTLTKAQYLPDCSDLQYLRSGILTPQPLVVVPTRAIADPVVSKKDRGGSLNLVRGRRKTRPSRV